MILPILGDVLLLRSTGWFVGIAVTVAVYPDLALGNALGSNNSRCDGADHTDHRAFDVSFRCSSCLA